MANSKPALLVVTHVDWDHAWQRPQALATALAGHYDVTVVSPVARRRGQLARNPRTGVDLRRVWRIPGSLRSPLAYRVNAQVVARQVAAIARQRPYAGMLVTAPECGAWTAGISGVPVAYDCMDDALAFDQDERVRSLRADDERALLARARCIVASAAPLVPTLLGRGARGAQVTWVPNGYDPSVFPIDEPSVAPAHGALRIGYFGTLGAWLDFPTLTAALDALPGASLTMIGPRDVAAQPPHPHIHFLPPVPNGELRHAVAGCHIMLLPFGDTPLTRAVDPVKLYEYIALGKPIVCRALPALERFAPFVQFYDSERSLVAALQAPGNLRAASTALREPFLAEATWVRRAQAVASALARGFESS